MSWIKIVARNDWGKIFYTYPHEGLNKYGTNNTDDALHLEDGIVLSVKWPDGSISEETLVKRNYRTTVADHGKYYDVESDIFGFFVKNRGISNYVDLAEVEIKDPSFKKQKEILKSHVKRGVLNVMGS